MIITIIFIFYGNDYRDNFRYKNEITYEIFAENFKLNDDLSYYDILSQNNESILFFWSSVCPHCETVIEFIESKDIHEEIKDKLFTVCLDSDLENVRKMEKNFPIFLDYNYKVFNKFDCEYIPSIFIVNSNGKIISKGEGGVESIDLINEFISKNKK